MLFIKNQSFPLFDPSGIKLFKINFFQGSKDQEAAGSQNLQVRGKEIGEQKLMEEDKDEKGDEDKIV